MREYLVGILSNPHDLNLTLILLNNLVALACALFIMFSYRITGAGPSYSRRYNLSLGMITLITTMIMSVISNNVALSLGMVGALSIVRFRTAVKDIRDTTFIFWAIAAGTGCGVSQYLLVAVGSAVVFLFLALMGQVESDNRHLLIVQSTPEVQNKVESAVQNYFGSAARSTMKSISGQGAEMIYLVQGSAIRKAASRNMTDIGQVLMKLDGVSRVNLVEQQEEPGK